MHSNTLLLPFALALLSTAACGGSTSSKDNPGNGDQDSGTGMEQDAQPAHDSGGTTGDSGVAGDTGSMVVDSGPPAIDGGKFLAIPLDQCGPALQYTVTATIGESQQFQVAIDTGSGSLGVVGSTCGATCSGITPQYTPDSTATDEMQVCMAQYDTGSWDGEIYQDNVALGSAPAVPTKFGSMTTQSNFLNPGYTQCVAHSSGGGVQGIIGFGPAGSAFPGTTGFFDEYVATENIPNLFAMRMCDTGGTLWMGGFDGTAVTAAPQFTPMIDPQYGSYYVDLETLSIGMTTIQIASGGYPSLVDTGSSLFFLNTNAYNQLVAALNGDPTVTSTLGSSFLTNGGCEAIQQSKAQLDAMLPSLTLTFGSGSSAISIQAAPTDSYLYFAGGQDWCAGIGDAGSVGGGSGRPTWARPS